MPGVSGRALNEQWRAVAADAYQRQRHGGDAAAVVRRYVDWVGNAHCLVRTTMSPDDIRRYLLTGRY